MRDRLSVLVWISPSRVKKEVIGYDRRDGHQDTEGRGDQGAGNAGHDHRDARSGPSAPGR